MIKRSITKHFKQLVKQYPVVTMTGPRQSGKTTIYKNVFPDYAYVNLEDLITRHYAANDPILL